jgi:hypothetical protein
MVTITRSRERSETFFPGVRSLSLVVVVLLLALPLASPENVVAADYVTPDAGGDIQVQPDAQVEQELYDVMDMPVSDLVYLDPDSIPDSPPPAEGEDLPDTTWVIRVPLDLRDLPDEVRKVGVICTVFKDGFDGPRSKLKIDVEGGAVQQTAVVGVQGNQWAVPDSPLHPANANRYECWMYLIGEDSHWRVPSTGNVVPTWLRADPDEPFRWQTGVRDLPPEARIE